MRLLVTIFCRIVKEVKKKIINPYVVLKSVCYLIVGICILSLMLVLNLPFIFYVWLLWSGFCRLFMWQTEPSQHSDQRLLMDVHQINIFNKQMANIWQLTKLLPLDSRDVDRFFDQYIKYFRITIGREYIITYLQVGQKLSCKFIWHNNSQQT